MNFQQSKSPLGITKAWPSGPGSFIVWQNMNVETPVVKFRNKPLRKRRPFGIKGYPDIGRLQSNLLQDSPRIAAGFI